MIEKDPKTHRSRRISPDPSTVATFRAQLDRMTARASLCGVSIGPDAYVWSQDPTCAVPYRPNRVTDGFRAVRSQLGFADIEFHHLRHFAAATLAGAGVDVRTIAGRLGHANPAITSRPTRTSSRPPTARRRRSWESSGSEPIQQFPLNRLDPTERWSSGRGHRPGRSSSGADRGEVGTHPGGPPGARSSRSVTARCRRSPIPLPSGEDSSGTTSSSSGLARLGG